MVNLSRYLDRRRRLINRALEGYFPTGSPGPPRLIEGIRYGLLDGGKRIRPILLLAAGETLGARIEPLLPFACAVEMIHAYSLIHDDLPAMDDDDLRRGKPTCHKVFGEGLAILTGDALLTEAFRVMLESAAGPVNVRRSIRAMREIADAAGPYGMVAGQAADLEAEGSLPDLPTVEFIHVRKTGALILASIRAGAILANARSADLHRLSRYGEFLGLAFQVTDDILDAEGPPLLTGKEAGRDRARRKATFPAVLGLPAAKQRARDLLESALAELGPLPDAADPLRQIARFVVGRACEVSRRSRLRARDADGKPG
jgi:geranylgeranyl diphosphate synthase type II